VSEPESTEAAARKSFIDGKRDLRLDFLRGYALVAMTLTHLGLASPLIAITGGSRFLINAAEVFFFISGYTMGYVAVDRPLRQQVLRRLGRTWLIYKYLLFFSFFLSLVLGQPELTRLNQGEAFGFLVGIVYLKEAVWGMDILIAYVLYVGIAPLALWALHAERTKTLAAAIFGIYITALVAPWTAHLEFAAFRNLAVNVPVFFVPLILGFKHKETTAWWKSQPGRKAAEAAALLAGSLLLVAFVLWGEQEWWKENFGNFAIREMLMPPQNLLLVFLYLGVLWLIVSRLWGFCVRILGWLTIPLGQDSLFVYGMHVVWIEFFRLLLDPVLPWYELAPFQLLGEAIVVGLLFGSVWLRRGLTVVFDRLEIGAWTRRHLLNTLVWSSLILLGVRILLTSEPGGWWWSDPDFLEEFF